MPFQLRVDFSFHNQSSKSLFFFFQINFNVGSHRVSIYF